MTRRAHRTRLRAVGSTAVLALLLAGCDSGDGSSTTTTSPTDTPRATTPTASTAPPAPPTTSPAATGPTLRLSHVSVALPAHWRVHFRGRVSADAFGPPGDALLALGQDDALGETLDQVAQDARSDSPHLKRGPDVTIDGVRAYVLTGVAQGTTTWTLGAVDHGLLVTVTLSTLHPAGFAALTDTIRAAIRLT